MTVSRARPGAVRADLDEVFRRDYRSVVGVAARVLGSLDQAEDVAQDVFLSFSRSSVPAGEARGWLCVAAAHTTLNLLRAGRRRASREESAGVADADRSHVAGCASCLGGLAAVQADATLVDTALTTDAGAHVDLAAAWRRLSAAAPAPGPARTAPLRARRAAGLLRRPAVAVLAVAVTVTGAGTAAANDWLQVFRTEQVAAVSITTDDLVALPD